MKIVVQGLWHLGCVTAAGAAKAGHQVMGLAENAAAALALQNGQAPLHEPGLDALLHEQIMAGRLNFTADPALALAEAELLWVAFDTPVDDSDQADIAYVMERVKALLPLLPENCVILLSSQLPVGSARALQADVEAIRPGAGITIACAPENLRLGSALKVFLEPDRIVLGAGEEATRLKLTTLFKPFNARLEWMSVASAEMTKHALNAFLATSVVFINEIAALCEVTGADAGEVARGLKSEQRIGPKAYLGPGAAFAGGTLARDLRFLSALAEKDGRGSSLFGAALGSNELHSHWPETALARLFPLGMKGQRIAIFGLSYKPGTDTLRRSPALELAQWLKKEGASVMGCDVLVTQIPESQSGLLQIAPDPATALAGATAIVLFHPWPGLETLYAALPMPRPSVIDPQGQFPGGPPQGCPHYVKVGHVMEAA